MHFNEIRGALAVNYDGRRSISASGLTSLIRLVQIVNREIGDEKSRASAKLRLSSGRTNQRLRRLSSESILQHFLTNSGTVFALRI